MEQFIPFIATIVGILLTDLLYGIGIGMAVAVLFTLRNNVRNPFYRIRDDAQNETEHLIVLSEVVTFLNKGCILQLLNSIRPNSHVIIDGTRSKFIHFDVREMIQNFKVHAREMGVSIDVRGDWLTDAKPSNYT